MGGIYLYKNNITNQFYIGQALDLNQRYNAHKSAIYNKESKEYNSYISKAFRKYGFENFSYEILAKNIENKEILNLLENYYISIYDSVYPNGYNKTYGGKMYFSWDKKRCKSFSLLKGAFTEKEIIDIRIAYKNKEKPTVVYQKYKDKITWGGFINIWRGTRYSYIMPEVFENKKSRRKMTKEQVIEIRERYGKEKLTYQQLADLYSVTKQTIRDIVTYYTWKNV